MVFVIPFYVYNRSSVALSTSRHPPPFVPECISAPLDGTFYRTASTAHIGKHYVLHDRQSRMSRMFVYIIQTSL